LGGEVGYTGEYGLLKVYEIPYQGGGADGKGMSMAEGRDWLEIDRSIADEYKGTTVTLPEGLPEMDPLPETVVTRYLSPVSR
jgi:hypothetical protein